MHFLWFWWYWIWCNLILEWFHDLHIYIYMYCRCFYLSNMIIIFTDHWWYAPRSPPTMTNTVPTYLHPSHFWRVLFGAFVVWHIFQVPSYPVSILWSLNIYIYYIGTHICILISIYPTIAGPWCCDLLPTKDTTSVVSSGRCAGQLRPKWWVISHDFPFVFFFWAQRLVTFCNRSRSLQFYVCFLPSAWAYDLRII